MKEETLFRLTTGKDGKYEYVSQKTLNYMKSLEVILKNRIKCAKFKVTIHSPIEKEIIGKYNEVMTELRIDCLIYGNVRYEIEVLDE